MTILLTGSSGFLGKIIHRVLDEHNNYVIGISRKGQAQNVDISKPFEFNTEVNIDAVVHAAGKAHSVPRTTNEENAFFEVNHQGTINVCNAIDKLPIKPRSFIFISTVSVYGLNSGDEINENSPLKGSTPYAKSKIYAEQYLQNWAKENNIVLSILRLPLIAGPNPPGNLGAMLKGIKTGRYLSIGNSNARKSIVWGEDIANVIPKLATTGGIYNLTDGHHPGFKELELAISKAYHKSKPFTIPLVLAMILGRVGNIIGKHFPITTDKVNKITSTLTFNDNRARETFGWSPSPVLDKLQDIL